MQRDPEFLLKLAGIWHVHNLDPDFFDDLASTGNAHFAAFPCAQHALCAWTYVLSDLVLTQRVSRLGM